MLHVFGGTILMVSGGGHLISRDISSVSATDLSFRWSVFPLFTLKTDVIVRPDPLSPSVSHWAVGMLQ